MGRVERIAALVAWTILASFLFMGFGMVLGEAVALTGQRLGLAPAGGLDAIVYAVRALAGLGMLGISRLYRLTAERENAGSLAAWLAGWALLLYSAAGAATLVDEQAAPAVLVMILFGWVLMRIARYFARPDAPASGADSADVAEGGGGAGPGPAGEGDAGADGAGDVGRPVGNPDPDRDRRDA